MKEELPSSSELFSSLIVQPSAVVLVVEASVFRVGGADDVPTRGEAHRGRTLSVAAIGR